MGYVKSHARQSSEENMVEKGHSKELGFGELVKILLKKFYVIVIATVIAAVVGGLVGFSNNKNVYAYGASAKFKISVYAKEGDVVSSDLNYIYKEAHLSMIVDELSSDRFISEKLMSEIENMPITDPEDPDYNEKLFYSWLNYLKSSISYSYDYAKNPNAITVSVKVYQNKDLAKVILDQVKKAVPEYISTNMIKPEDVDITDAYGNIIGTREYETHCDEMTISYVRQLNAGQSESKTKEYAILFGFFAAVVSAVVVIVLETSDIHLFKKKEKDQDVEEQ